MGKERAAMVPTYSLVVPIFNEEAVIPILLRRLDAPRQLHSRTEPMGSRDSHRRKESKRLGMRP